MLCLDISNMWLLQSYTIQQMWWSLLFNAPARTRNRLGAQDFRFNAHALPYVTTFLPQIKHKTYIHTYIPSYFYFYFIFPVHPHSLHLFHLLRCTEPSKAYPVFDSSSALSIPLSLRLSRTSSFKFRQISPRPVDPCLNCWALASSYIALLGPWLRTPPFPVPMYHHSFFVSGRSAHSSSISFSKGPRQASESDGT